MVKCNISNIFRDWKCLLIVSSIFSETYLKIYLKYSGHIASFKRIFAESLIIVLNQSRIENFIINFSATI